MAAGTSSRYPVHEGLNIAIFCAALPVTWALLWVASHLSLGWALLSATVGFVLRMIEERVEGVGRLVAGLVGVAWSVAT